MTVIPEEIKKESLATLGKLVGMSWDQLLQWVVVAYACCWVWLEWFDNPHPRLPITWGLDMAASLGLPTKSWANDLLDWRTNIAPDWMPATLIAIAAVLGASLARPQAGHGRVALATVAVLFAIELGGTPFATIAWILALTAAPMFLSLLVYVTKRSRRSESGGFEYHPWLTLSRFLTGPLVPFWLSCLAPLILVGNLVEQYGFDNDHEPAEELLLDSARELKSSGVSVAEVPATTLLAAIAGLSMMPAARRRWASMGLHATVNGPTGAR